MCQYYYDYSVYIYFLDSSELLYNISFAEWKGDFLGYNSLSDLDILSYSNSFYFYFCFIYFSPYR